MQVMKLLKDEANCLIVKEPVTIVGDIHGQYYDTVNMLEQFGWPGITMNYLFLGDYVDRGIRGVQCCILLFCLKLA